MNLIIKTIILSLIFNFSLFAQTNNKTKQEKKLNKTKIVVQSDKKTYKIGEIIKIIVEWNEGEIIDENNFRKRIDLNLIKSAYKWSFFDGVKLQKYIYTFKANKKGKMKIPRFKIENNSIIYKSNNLKIRIKN